MPGRRGRGITLPLVMGLMILFYVLFLALHSNLRQARTRLAQHKHQAAAHWLAISGLDIAEVRLARGTYRVGEVISPPQMQQGRFVVTSRREGSRVILESVGYAADKKIRLTRTVEPG